MASMLLSSEERHFIVTGVEDDFRNDGRSCEDYRRISVKTRVISNTNGSAEVALVGTHVMFGVKAEIGEPLPTTPNEGRIEFFVDCSANASPIFEGRGGDDLALELSCALKRTFCNGAMDLTSLGIIPGRSCWVLHVDALVLECGGNLFDALSLGVKSALYSTRLPKLQVIGEGSEKDIEISDDPYDTVSLDVQNVPILVTLNKVGTRYVVDATAEEEGVSECQLLISVNEKGQVCSVQKHGSGGLNPDLVFEMMRVGQKIGKTVNESLMRVLKDENINELI